MNNTKKILIIDDEVEIIGKRFLRRIKKIFEKEEYKDKYEVFYAAYFHEARDIMSEKNISYVFCDQNMNEEINGIEFIDELVNEGYVDIVYTLLTSEDGSFKKLALSLKTRIKNINYIQKTGNFEDDFLEIINQSI